MEMQRYVKHSAGWWWITAACIAIAICCMVKAVQVEKYRETMELSPLLVGEEQPGDYSYIDVVDMHLLTTDGRDCMLRLSGDAACRSAEEILQAVFVRNSKVLVGRTRENSLRYDRQVPRIRQQRVHRAVLWGASFAMTAAALLILYLI